MAARLAKRQPSRRRASIVVLALIACVLLAFGLHGFVARYRATHNSNAVPQSNRTVTYSSSTPDETPIDRAIDYAVPPNQPRTITLPTIDAEGFIQKVGVDQNNAVAVPGNIHLAGWYVSQAIPGQEGVSLIDGHVQGKYRPGIFKNLSRLTVGDQFTIEFGDRHTETFEVVRIDRYVAAVAAKYMAKPFVGISRQLNLITCDGRFDVKTKEYDQRLLVVSKLVARND